MGVLVNGEWHHKGYDTESNNGKFIRESARFRHWITPDGAAGPTGEGGFNAEPGRYHLYVSLACPWAHRTLIFRQLKGLQDFISLSIVNAFMGEDGWSFAPGPDVIADHINHQTYLRDIYTLADPQYSGRVTVPVLWDKHRQTIVNNESADIIRMFNQAFDSAGACAGDFYPAELQREIDQLNARVYDHVNNGVYKAGFATTQAAYDEAVGNLFAVLDELEQRLAKHRYLVGNRLTEADWRLFTTLIRFDAVYVGHFKCNIRRIADYANLSNYLRDLYQQPGIAGTVNIPHIKTHYYTSHESINPTRIVPQGPQLDLERSHNRDRFKTDKCITTVNNEERRYD